MKAFIDFYKQEKISPVSQDISDLEKHIRRRDALYRHVGIIPSFVRGRRVLEFGPGSGHNAMHTASLEPAEYYLVDANPTGLEGVRALFDEHFEDQSNIHVVESFIEEFKSDVPFDIVLCEGLLPLQDDPPGLLRHVASFVAPGGVLVITCIDSVTYIAEQLRRVAAAVLTSPDQSTAEKMAILLPEFSPHLAQIEGMSRPHEDYILDNIIQPFKDRPLLGVDQAIDAVSDEMNFYGTSPQFVTDWRWYKKITADRADFNRWGKEAYLANRHNFLDSRTPPVAGDPSMNEELLATCDRIYEEIIRYDTERDPAGLDRIDADLGKISPIVGTFSKLTRDSIEDFRTAMKKARDGERDIAWGSFAGWFGQGQVYVSFLRGR